MWELFDITSLSPNGISSPNNYTGIAIQKKKKSWGDYHHSDDSVKVRKRTIETCSGMNVALCFQP